MHSTMEKISYNIMGMINIGIIGVGKWGKNHVRTFSQLPVRIIGIADQQDNEERRQFAAEFHAPFYQNYKDLLPLADAICVVTPTDKHYEIVKDALLAGKHVFVEKPMTNSATKTKELVELARAKKLVLSVGYLHRFNPAIVKIKELIPSIGSLQYIAMRYIHSSNPPRKDSGAILNLGSHMIDALNFILTERPKRVSCNRVNYIHAEREDSAHILLDYGPFFASIEVSSCHPEKKRDLWIIAGKEKIYADLLEQKVTRYPIAVSEELIDALPAIQETIVNKEPLREQLRHFVENVANKKSGKKELDNISKADYHTTHICDLALQSAISRRDYYLV